MYLDKSFFIFDCYNRIFILEFNEYFFLLFSKIYWECRFIEFLKMRCFDLVFLKLKLGRYDDSLFCYWIIIVF